MIVLMSKFTQKGAAHLFLLILILAGIGLGVYLVGQRTQLFPWAASNPIPTPCSVSAPCPSVSTLPSLMPSASVSASPVSTATPVASLSKPVFRLFNFGILHNFYTISPAERDAAVRYYGYYLIGTSFNAFESEVAATKPVYRLSNAYGDQFYTISSAERDAAVRYYGYKLEGRAFYAYETQVAGTLPVYKLINNIGDHFYTKSITERDEAINRYGYRLEGTAFFVPAQ